MPVSDGDPYPKCTFVLFMQAESKANGETVLANFFNSLLSTKKTPGSKGSRATSRTEAAAEIEKMTKKS